MAAKGLIDRDVHGLYISADILPNALCSTSRSNYCP